ncbi:MAG: DUF4836 family protein [Prevotella sp.]|nr:DUF4836 family protein [Prevotella sp.]
MKRVIPLVMICISGMLLTACSNADYIHAIPEGSTALASVDVATLGSQTKLESKANPFLSWLGVNDAAECGMDFRSKLYFFETADGNLGAVAKVNNRSKLEKVITQMAEAKKAKPLVEKKGFAFTVLNGTWVVGVSDCALMVMGPALSNVQTQLMSQMAKWLSQDEESSMVGTPMFERLDSIQSGVALVAQAQALPEKLASLFTLGAPKDADASQVVLAAEMGVADGQLQIKGETFSFNRRINEALQLSAKAFRPVKGKYGAVAASNHLVTLFMNVDGKQFLPLLRQNEFWQTMLMGVNTAIDMDNIIKAIDGDVAVAVNSLDAASFNMSMGAEMGSLAFVEDIGYWKQSCPQGSRIDDWQKNGWMFTNGKQNVYFGVSDGSAPLFYSGTDKEAALMMAKPAASSLQYEGEKLVAIIRLSQVDNDVVKTFMSILEPMFGKLDSIVYMRK